MSLSDHRSLQRAAALRDLEIALRSAARTIEHANVALCDPVAAATVDQLIRQAGGLRKARMALLGRLGLR